MPPPSIAILAPVRGGFASSYVSGLIELAGAFAQVGITWEWIPCVDMPVTFARNHLAAQFIESGHDFALWIDADTRIPVDAVRQLVVAGHDCAVIACANRPRDGRVLTLREGERFCNTDVLDLEQTPEGGFIRVESSGFGCVWTSRACIARIVAAHPELAFSRPYQGTALFSEMVADGEWLAEDQSFFRRWRDLGGELWAPLDVESNHAGLLFHLGRDLWDRRDELRRLSVEAAEAIAVLRDEIAQLRACKPHAPELDDARWLVDASHHFVMRQPAVGAIIPRIREVTAKIQGARGVVARPCACGSGRPFAGCHGEGAAA